MKSTIRAAYTRPHLSRHERQRQARAEAFSRRPTTIPIRPSPVKLATADLELIDRLVRRDRTAVSTAVLVIAEIGAGEPSRQAVLSRIGEAASWAQAEGAISSRRADGLCHRPGSGGQSPPRASIASAIAA